MGGEELFKMFFVLGKHVTFDKLTSSLNLEMLCVSSVERLRKIELYILSSSVFNATVYALFLTANILLFMSYYL